MPRYDYECSQCGHAFEASQKMLDAPLVKCPVCGKEKLRRLIGGGAGIIFKGPGFYATDYRKDSRAASIKPGEPSCPKSKEGCNACPHSHG